MGGDRRSLKRPYCELDRGSLIGVNVADIRRITETGVEILTRPPASSSASKKKKKKKSKTAAAGDLDGDEEGGSGAATPTAEATAGVEGLKVNGQANGSSH